MPDPYSMPVLLLKRLRSRSKVCFALASLVVLTACASTPGPATSGMQLNIPPVSVLPGQHIEAVSIHIDCADVASPGSYREPWEVAVERLEDEAQIVASLEGDVIEMSDWVSPLDSEFRLPAVVLAAVDLSCLNVGALIELACDGVQQSCHPLAWESGEADWSPSVPIEAIP